MPDLRRYLAAACILLPGGLLPAAAVAQEAAAAYEVLDSASGHVLLGQNENKRLGVGSLANIATAIVVLDWMEIKKHDISESVVIPQEALASSQNPIGFQPGDRASIRDLLYAMLMQSDDIAAHALAAHVGQELPAATPESTPVQRFVAQMNALARQLNMRNTLFVNPAGSETNERKLPYSTAADMALLARNAMNHSQFRFYVSQAAREISIDRAALAPGGYALQNTNELLGIDAIDGVRTGTTRRTGASVIISAARAPESVQQGTQYVITPRRLIVVVLGAASRFDLAHRFLRSGWQAYDQWSAGGRQQKRS